MPDGAGALQYTTSRFRSTPKCKNRIYIAWKQIHILYCVFFVFFLLFARIVRGEYPWAQHVAALKRSWGFHAVSITFRNFHLLCETVVDSDAELKMSEIRCANDCAVVLSQQQQSEMFRLLRSLCRRQEKQWICKAVIFANFPVPCSMQICAYIYIAFFFFFYEPTGVDGCKNGCRKWENEAVCSQAIVS